MLISRYDKGDVLVTFATGEFSEAEGERTGLVPGHAYAMLDVKFAQVISAASIWRCSIYNGLESDTFSVLQNKRLFLLKNPWSHMRWKGRYSERDIDSWTPELQQALRFDPKNAKNFDNGKWHYTFDTLIH